MNKLPDKCVFVPPHKTRIDNIKEALKKLYMIEKTIHYQDTHNTYFVMLRACSSALWWGLNSNMIELFLNSTKLHKSIINSIMCSLSMKLVDGSYLNNYSLT